MYQAGNRSTFPHLFIVSCILLFASLINDLSAQAILQHTAMNEAVSGRTLSLTAQYDGTDGRVLTMRIYFRSPEQQSYRFIDMQQGGDGWMGNIPGRFLQGERLHYFITALLDNKTVITFPAVNPYYKPLSLTIKQAPPAVQKPITPPIVETPIMLEPVVIAPLKIPDETAIARDEKTDAPPAQLILEPARPDTLIEPPQPMAGSDSDSTLQFLVLSPESHESLLGGEVNLAVSFLADSALLDTSSIKIYLDGQEVTQRVEKSASLISLQPAHLSKGVHWFKVTGNTDQGRAIMPAVVSFNIMSELKESQTAIDWRGHVFAEIGHEQFYRNDEQFAMGGGDFSGRYGSLEFSGNFFITSLENRRYQPRNRYSLSAGTRWLGLRAGDIYPQMNELILWGKRVRGLSAYLHLGFFNLDVITGESNRAVKSITAQAIGAGGQDSTYAVSYGSFRQSMIGIRPSIGNGRQFQLGFTIAKIKDDIASIKFGLAPKDNLVLGPDFHISFLRNRLRFEAMAAFSLLTNDIHTGSISSDELENVFGKVDLPFDPQDFDNLLIINDTTVPLNPLSLGSFAYRLQMRINYWNHFITAGYKSIGPEYLSLGNPWMRKDVQGFFISDRMRLLQNKIYLNLGYEGLADNFSQQNNDPVVDLLTMNYAITAVPGGRWPMVNLSLRDHYRNNHLNRLDSLQWQISDGPEFLPADTSVIRDLREKQLYRDMTAQINKDFRFLQLKHQAMFSYLLSRNMDGFENSRLPGAPSQNLDNRMVLFVLSTQFRTPLKSTLSVSNSKNASSGSQTVAYTSASLGAEYAILNGQMTLYSEARFTTIASWVNSQKTQLRRDQIRLGALWQLAGRHTLMADVNFLLNSGGLSTDGRSSSYNDVFVRLRYDKYLKPVL